MARRATFVFVAAALTTAPELGCSESCTDHLVSSIVVVARDAKTREAICDANLVASDGARTGTFEPVRFEGEECRYGVVGLGPGEYEVAISHPLYVDAQLHDVEVHESEGGCHVDGAFREVTLYPK